MIRSLLRPIVVTVAAAGFAGAVFASDHARAENTFVYGMPADHSILDPHVTCGWMAKMVNYQIYEALVENRSPKRRLADKAQGATRRVMGDL